MECHRISADEDAASQAGGWKGGSGAVKRWLISLLLTLVVAMFFEQYVILRQVDSLILRQTDVFLNYIKTLGPPKREYESSLFYTKAYDCVTKKIGIIYSYKLCVRFTNRDADSGENRYILQVILPMGFLNPIPNDFLDPELVSKIDVFVFYNGEVKQQLFIGQLRLW